MTQMLVADDGPFNTTDVPVMQQGSVEKENTLSELQTRKQRLLALQVRTETDEEDDLEIIADDDFFPSVNHRHLTDKRKHQTSFRASKRERLGGGSAAHLQVEHRSNKAGNAEKAALTQIELSRMLAQQVTERNKQLIAQKDEEWVKRGGQLRGLVEGTQDTLKTHVEKGIMRHSKRQLEFDDRLMGEANDSSDPSSSDDESGTAHSPVPTDVQPDQEEEEEPKFKMRRHRKAAILDSDSEIEKDEARLSKDVVFKIGSSTPLADESDEKHGAVIPSEDAVYNFGSSSLGHMQLTDESDENSIPPASLSPFSIHRDSVSSLDDQAEDRSDKENNRILMFDRGEDKENKAIVRHCSPKGLSDTRDDANLLSGLDASGRELHEEKILKDDKRSPLTVLSEDQSSRSQSDPSWADISTPHSHRSTSPMAQIAEVIQREGDVSSASSEAKFNATLLPEASFSALFESGTEDPKPLRISTGTTSERVSGLLLL